MTTHSEKELGLGDASRPGDGVDGDPMPVFVIKAKDNFAPVIVRRYATEIEGDGLLEQGRQAWLALTEIVAWRERHPELCKHPDHEHVPATQVAESIREAREAVVLALRSAEFYAHCKSPQCLQCDPTGEGHEICGELCRDVAAALVALGLKPRWPSSSPASPQAAHHPTEAVQ